MYASKKCAQFEICIIKMAGAISHENIKKTVLRKPRIYCSGPFPPKGPRGLITIPYLIECQVSLASR